jgi:predicted flap endonuclease-1-like 5' DNA nuclease/chromosome segregation ATPase
VTQANLTRDLRSESADLQARLHATLLRLEEESSARRAADEQLARTRTAVERVRAANEATQKALAEKTAQANGALRSVEQQLRESQATQSQRESEVTRLRLALGALEREKDALALQLSDQLGHIASLEARAEAATVACRSMRAQLAVTKDQNALLQEQLADVDALVGRFPVQQMTIRQLEQEKARATQREALLTGRLREAGEVARRLEQRYRQTLHYMRRLLQGQPAKKPALPAGANGGQPPPASLADPLAELRRINGIGPTYARRLLDAGFGSLALLAAASPEALGSAAGLRPNQETRAADWINQAQTLAHRAAGDAPLN